MILHEQEPLSPGLKPYVYIEWGKTDRIAEITIGGGFKKDVHLPDIIERLRSLADELVVAQKGQKNG